MRSRLIATVALASLLGPQVVATLVAAHVALEHADEHGHQSAHRDPHANEVTTSDHDHALSPGQTEAATASRLRTQLAAPAVLTFATLLPPVICPDDGALARHQTDAIPFPG